MVVAGERLLVVSPHLDDAVFGCAALIASLPGAIVVTVFAGAPVLPTRTEWDVACGFCDSQQAISTRRAEDKAALDLLGATPRWLPFCDAQYGIAPPPGAIARVLRAEMQRSSCTLAAIPLGLFHSDHIAAHSAALDALRLVSRVRAIAYADARYRTIPELMRRRVRELACAGIALTPRLDLPCESPLKPRALACYASQLRALGTPGRMGHADTLRPEQYWSLRLSSAGQAPWRDP